MINQNPKYSLLVPVYNEAAAVVPLFYSLKKTLNNLNQPYEIIFINDGSTDNTLKNLIQLTPIKIITLRKNYGQTQALDAGIKQATGDIIITLDGDGQNPPEEIPKLLKKFNQGYDVVSGWRYPRHDPLAKKISSRGANFLRSFLVKDYIHDSGCTLKAYKAECLKNLDLHGEMHRFIPAILRWQGYKIGEVKVEHKPRLNGKTKYSSKRIVKGFIDMISIWFWRKYSSRPLHLFGGLGILIGGIGSIMLISLLIARWLNYIDLSNSIWSLISVFLIMVGLQLFVSGILADIAVKNYYKNGKTSYNIKKIIEK